MGTRSSTYVYSSGNKPIVCMYRQLDGYPSGHGVELAEFLNSGKIVNGIPAGYQQLIFNGMGCLAATMVAHFKDGPGGFYLHVPDLNQDCWQEYEYHVYENRIVVKDPTEVIFDDSWNNFTNFCEEGVTG